MRSTKVSVIIPAYNNAHFLGEAIQSVLDQTYPNFELIVVNDASPDDTLAVVSQFPDPRVRYIVHEQNQGLSAARNTGIKASEGEVIALLDGDDIFHPEKFQVHVDFLEQHPEIGVTYNSRFELNHSARTVRALWHPAATVTLADLVFGFPFSPSDMVLRREWAFKVDLFDKYYVYVGEDLDLNCRLALADCKFAGVDRALNYRRYHSGRSMSNLKSAVEYTLRPLYATFADLRCPQNVLALRDKAIANHLLLWSIIALIQGETQLGQEYCLEATRLNPSILVGQPNQLVKTMLMYSIVDESQDHVSQLRSLSEQLPAELACDERWQQWMVGRGYLEKGTRAVIWGQNEEGRDYFAQAAAVQAQIDDSLAQDITAQLLDYEAEFGYEATRKIMQNLVPHLQKVGSRSQVRRLKGQYSINKAFQNYRMGQYAMVPGEVISAFAHNPKYIANRGALSILLRSIIGMMPQLNG